MLTVTRDIVMETIEAKNMKAARSKAIDLRAGFSAAIGVKTIGFPRVRRIYKNTHLPLLFTN